MSIDTTLDMLRGVLSIELEQRTINGLPQIAASKLRRTAIQQHMAEIDGILATLRTAINALPALPPDEQIEWAQNVAAMPNLVFLELDTTGLSTTEDELVRFTLVAGTGDLLEDILIRPTTRTLSATASHANGIQGEALTHAPTIEQGWDRLRQALRGKYVLSFNQQWDRAQLVNAAHRSNLSSLGFVGEDIQAQYTRYYHREYSLSLSHLCERAGFALPEPPEQTSIDRAKGQYHLLHAMAQGITDVRPPTAKQEAVSPASSILHEAGDAALGDIDEHPF